MDDHHPPCPSPLRDDTDAKLPAAAFLRYESRADGWSAGRQAAFLAHLADHGVVEDAARSVGKHISGGYALRREARGYAFNLGWEAALIIARRIVADNLMAAAIRGEQSRWVREDGVTTYTRQNTKLSLTLLDRINPATSLAEVLAVATRFDWFLQLLADGVDAETLWKLFFEDALPHNEVEARARVRVALLLTEDSAGFERDGDGQNEPPVEYKSMDGPPPKQGADGQQLFDRHQLARKGHHQLCCILPIRSQPRLIIGLGQNHRHRLGMEGCDQWVGLARQKGKDLGGIRRIACPDQIERRLFGQLGPAPYTRERPNLAVFHGEPVLLSSRADLRLGKGREGDEAALFGPHQHRPPKRAGKIADIGDVFRHFRSWPLSRKRQWHAPGHDIDKGAARLFALPHHRRLAPGPDIFIERVGFGRRLGVDAPRNIFAPALQKFLRAGDVAVMVAHERKTACVSPGLQCPTLTQIKALHMKRE